MEKGLVGEYDGTPSRVKPISNTALWALLFTSVVYFFSYPEVDPDLWGHLFFGKEILKAGRIPLANLYSYTAPEHPWINHEWLSEVIFYGVYRLSGSPGLIFFKLALGSAVIWLLDVSLRQAAFSFCVRATALIWATAILSPGFNVRPQIFTYGLFAALLCLFYRYEASGHKVIYWAPVLLAAWVNLHGGFVAGVGALGLFFLFRLGAELKRAETVRSTSIHLGIPLVIAASFLLINPYGLRLLDFIAQDLLLERPITEWEPIALLNLSFPAFKLALVCVLFAALRNGSWRRWDFILAFLAALFALRYQRHTPLFAIVATPLLAATLERAYRWVKTRMSEWLFTFVILAVAAYQLVTIGKLHLDHRFQLIVNPYEYPTQAADFLRRNGVRGNLAVPFDWGEYFIWKLYPDVRISIDGRYTTAYPPAVIEDNFEWMRGGKGWRRLLERYPTDIAITHRNHPVTALMRRDPEWVYVYSDPVAFIFVRKVPEQEELLKKFAEKRLVPPQSSPFYFPG